MLVKFKKYLKHHPVLLTLLEAYVLTEILISISGILYFYFRTNLIFFVITIIVFSCSYLGPIWFKLFLKADSYSGEYRNKLLKYSNELKCNLKDIYVRKSTSLNACAFSFENNKTVCFNSEVFQRCSWKEIKGVMTHEIGHHMNGDIMLYTSTVSLILIASSWSGVTFLGNSHSAIKLMGFFLVLSLFLVPLELAVSRWREGLEDDFTKKMLKNASGLSDFLNKVLVDSYHDGMNIPMTPSLIRRLTGTHPWIHERIKHLE